MKVCFRRSGAVVLCLVVVITAGSLSAAPRERNQGERNALERFKTVIRIVMRAFIPAANSDQVTLPKPDQPPSTTTP
jgi:hypothetical protein